METMSVNRKCKTAEVEEEVITRGESMTEELFFIFIFDDKRNMCECQWIGSMKER